VGLLPLQQTKESSNEGPLFGVIHPYVSHPRRDPILYLFPSYIHISYFHTHILLGIWGISLPYMFTHTYDANLSPGGSPEPQSRTSNRAFLVQISQRCTEICYSTQNRRNTAEHSYSGPKIAPTIKYITINIDPYDDVNG
jgi:hypothetical protein